ncbi:MAG: hypothetical protein Q9219_006470 [cf. Caloplaca sp. 3 TL-2023]
MPTSLGGKPSSLVTRGAEGEPFLCPDPAAAAAGKQALIGFGAEVIEIAMAMLENGCAFTAAFNIGNNKQGDSAELGVYRNNWHMLRENCDRFKGAQPGDWLTLGQQVQYVAEK